MKWIIVFLLVIFSLTANSQVLRYRAFQTKVIYGEKYTTSDGWKYSSTVVIFDPENKNFKVFEPNKERNLIVISSLGSSRTDEGELLNFQAIDQDGLRCVVSMMLFDNPTKDHCSTLLISYTNVTYTYRLKIL